MTRASTPVYGQSTRCLKEFVARYLNDGYTFIRGRLTGKLPLVFTHADARSYGISDRQLYEWRNTEQIETLGRGIFIRPGLDVDHGLLEILL